MQPGAMSRVWIQLKSLPHGRLGHVSAQVLTCQAHNASVRGAQGTLPVALSPKHLG